MENYDFNATDAKKIWCFGPSNSGPNMLVDCTRGVQNLQDVKDVMVAGFQWASEEVRFSIALIKLFYKVYHY